MDEIDEMVMDALAERGGAVEAYAIRHYRFYRNTQEGTVQECAVEITIDRRGHYNLSIMTEDNVEVSGNGADSLQAALRVVHWNELP